MVYDTIKNSTLARSLADTVGDFSDVVRTEMRLAAAELSDKAKHAALAGVWMAIAGVFWLLTLAVIAEAIIFAIASEGLALHWACLIVAAGLAIIGAIAFFGGRSAAQPDMLPTRAIRQMNETIRTAKEQFS
jgi:uncharacterized membrane protein YqjE